MSTNDFPHFTACTFVLGCYFLRNSFFSCCNRKYSYLLSRLHRRPGNVKDEDVLGPVEVGQQLSVSPGTAAAAPVSPAADACRRAGNQWMPHLWRCWRVLGRGASLVLEHPGGGHPPELTPLAGLLLPEEDPGALHVQHQLLPLQGGEGGGAAFGARPCSGRQGGKRGGGEGGSQGDVDEVFVRQLGALAEDVHIVEGARAAWKGIMTKSCRVTRRIPYQVPCR